MSLYVFNSTFANGTLTDFSVRGVGNVSRIGTRGGILG